MKYNKHTTFFLQAMGLDLLVYNDFSDSENLNHTNVVWTFIFCVCFFQVLHHTIVYFYVQKQNLISPSVVLLLDFGIIFLPVIKSNMP